jgi:hypothetical protein
MFDPSRNFGTASEGFLTLLRFPFRSNDSRQDKASAKLSTVENVSVVDQLSTTFIHNCDLLIARMKTTSHNHHC